MDLAIITAAWKRPALTRLVFAHYRRAFPEALLVAAVSEDTAQEDAAAAGWVPVRVPNSPLGGKWNAASLRAIKEQPGALMIVGSDDLVSKEYVTEGLQAIQAGVDVYSSPRLDFYDAKADQLYEWLGYKQDPRHIDTARILSPKAYAYGGGKLFEAKADRGIAGRVQRHMRASKKYQHQAASAGYVVDVKGSTNIWGMADMIRSSKLRKVPHEEARERLRQIGDSTYKGLREWRSAAFGGALG